MAEVIQSPARYRPDEWKHSNKLNYSGAEASRIVAERLRAETKRLCTAVNEQTVRTREDVEFKFSARLHDIDFVKKELELKISENAAETDALVAARAILEEALRSTAFPHEVATSCLSYREGRIGIDLVHDDVEIQLKKEVEVIEGVQGMFQGALDECTEQIRLLKAANYQLKKDLIDKFSALDIDSSCTQLKITSDDINYQKDVAKIPSNSNTPAQWEDYSNTNILKSEKQQNASGTLRGVVNGLMNQAAQDILLQRQTVNRAFQKRIEEVQKAHDDLVGHLEKVKQEIEEMEKNIEFLKDTIEDKSGPMKLAQTRLEKRGHRPRQELVRDPVQYKLVAEVNQIGNNIEQLCTLLYNNEQSLKELLRTQLALEEDISVKANSLFIDTQQCVKLRQQLSPN